MPFNTLLLPLLGGYIFITFWNHTRFSSKRYSGERLIFHSAAAGVVFLAIAFAVTRSLMLIWPALFHWWRGIVPFPYTGTSFLAFAAGATAWWPLNCWRFDREKEAQRVIREWNDYLEILLDDAARQTGQVSITLKGRKVYVGFIMRVFDPAYDRKYISILPVVSGYRDELTLNVIFDTDYARTYREMIRPGSQRIVTGVNDFQVIIPVSEIQSANRFDWDAYSIFQSANLPPPSMTSIPVEVPE